MRIILAWELGANYGHSALLSACARELTGQGHEVTVALRDLTRSVPFFQDIDCPLLQAPVFMPKLKLNRLIASQADVLALNGFHDKDTLRPLLQAWRRLLELTRAELLIGDYAPVAQLAAHVAGLPRMAIGNGFTLPAAGRPLADWRPGAAGDNVVAAQEQHVLDAVNRVTGADKALSCLSDLYRCDKVLINTFPLLDIYAGSRTGAEYCAHHVQFLKHSDVFDAGEGRRISCYLHPSYKRLKELCGALAQLDAQVLAFCPGIGARLAEEYSGGRFRLYDRMANLNSLVAVSDLFIGHGSMSTTTQSLRLGKPCLVLPMQLEQLNNGMIVQRNSLGKVVPDLESTAAFASVIDRFLQDGQAASAAARFAVENERYCRKPFAVVAAEAVKALSTIHPAGFPFRP